MTAKILQPTKSAMQSGPKGSPWIIEFDSSPGSTFTDTEMGWLGTTDTQPEVKLSFPTLELATQYAERNEIDYELILPSSRKLVKKAYADNFK